MADNVDDDDANLELDEEIDHQVQAEANQFGNTSSNNRLIKIVYYNELMQNIVHCYSNIFSE